MLFADACLAGFGAVRRSKRLLFCAALATAMAALPFAVWGARQADAVGAHRPDALEAARFLDPDMTADLRSANASFDADATTLVVVSLVLAFLIRPLLSGGYAGVAATQRRLTFGMFVREGGNSYWKYLRISAIGVVLLLLASVGLKPLLEQVRRFADETASEVEARNARLLVEVIAFLALCLIPLVCDYARVGVRMRRRPGVFGELWRSVLFVLQHPFRTVGFYLTGLALEIALAAPLVLLLRAADGRFVRSSIVVLFLGQVLVAVREAARLFHLAGAWKIREAEERAAPKGPEGSDLEGGDLLAQPLPWHVR
jgi:hypothetical protein